MGGNFHEIYFGGEYSPLWGGNKNCGSEYLSKSYFMKNYLFFSDSRNFGPEKFGFRR